MNDTSKESKTNMPPQMMPPYRCDPCAAPLKKRFKLNAADRVFAFALLVLCILLVANGLLKGMYFGFTLFFTLIFAVVSFYLYNKSTKPGVYECICGVLALAGGAVYSVTDNLFVRFLLVPMLFVLCVIWFASLAGTKSPDGDLGLLMLIFKHGFRDSVSNIPVSLSSIAAGEKGQKRKWIKALIGALCCLPLACIVVLLLMGADNAFDLLVFDFFSGLGESIIYFVGGLILSVFGIAFCYSLKKQSPQKENCRDMSKIDGVYVAAFLFLLSVCYLAYLFSQLSYFFDAFKSILPVQFSYSEYARTGFFELCAVSLINLAVIFCALVFTTKKNGKLPIIVKVLSVFVSVFTLLLCATSFAKMVMYINTYGLTVLRVCSFSIMVFIVVVFVTIMIRLFSCKGKILHTAVATAGILLVTLGLANVDKVICAYNYNAYVSGKTAEIDLRTLQEAGVAGIPYLEILSHSENEKLAKNAVNRLYDSLYGYYFLNENGNFLPEKDNRAYQGFAQYNYSLQEAYKVLEKFDFKAHEPELLWNESDDTEKTKAMFQPENFYDLEFFLDSVYNVVRRGMDSGELKAGDELEFCGGKEAALSVVKPDGTLYPLTVSVSEKDDIINAAAIAPCLCKLKIYTDAVHFYCDESSGIQDRIVRSVSESEPSETIEENGEIVFFASECLDGNWYVLYYMYSEAL